MRTIAVLILIAIFAPAAAEECRIGTNRPGIDADPAQRIDASAPRMRCEQTIVRSQAPDGRSVERRQWNFEVR
jgi:hypothetical protein